MVSSAAEFHLFAGLGARYITVNVAALIAGTLKDVIAGVKAAG